jgi:hypothetical protein
MTAMELDDLEAARDGLAAADMAMVALSLAHPGVRDELVPAMLEVDRVVETLTRTLEAHGRASTTSGVYELAGGGHR